MASSRRRDEEKPLKRVQIDNSRVHLENRDLDQNLHDRIDSIEKKQVHVRYNRQAQIDEIHQAARREDLLIRMRNQSAAEELERQKERDRQQLLAQFGKKLREGTNDSVLPDFEGESDSDDDEAWSRRRSHLRSTGESSSARSVRKRGMSASERDKYFDQLARPRLTSYLLMAQMTVVKVRNQSRPCLSRTELQNPSSEVEENMRQNKLQNELRGIILHSHIVNCRAHSAKVESRIRSFCSEVQTFVKSSQPENVLQKLTNYG